MKSFKFTLTKQQENAVMDHIKKAESYGTANAPNFGVVLCQVTRMRNGTTGTIKPGIHVEGSFIPHKYAKLIQGILELAFEDKVDE